MRLRSLQERLRSSVRFRCTAFHSRAIRAGSARLSIRFSRGTIDSPRMWSRERSDAASGLHRVERARSTRRTLQEKGQLLIREVHPSRRNRRQAHLSRSALECEPTALKVRRHHKSKLSPLPPIRRAARLRATLGVHPTLNCGRMNLPRFPFTSLSVHEPSIRHPLYLWHRRSSGKTRAHFLAMMRLRAAERHIFRKRSEGAPKDALCAGGGAELPVMR